MHNKFAQRLAKNSFLAFVLFLACGIAFYIDAVFSGEPLYQVVSLVRLVSVFATGILIFLLLKFFLKSFSLFRGLNSEEKSPFRSEQLFKTLVQEGGDLMGIIDRDGNITYMSPSSVSIIGVDPLSSIGSNGFDSVHPEDLEMVKEDFARLNSHKRVQLKTYRFKFGSGEYKWLDTVLTNLLDDPIIKGIVINSRDVTERINREKLIQSKNEEINKIFNYSRDVICAINEKGQFVKVSSASLAAWGYRPEELVEKDYLSLVVEADKSKTNQVAAQIMSGQPITKFENRYMHKNGSVVPMIWSAIWDEQENLMYAIAQDASEMIHLEKRIKNKQQRFARIFAEAPLSMCILKGPHHTFVDVNDLYTALTGRKNIIGKTVREGLPELEDQGYLNWLDEVYATGKTISGHEAPFIIDIEGNGTLTKRYVNFIYQPYINSNGEIEGVYFFGIDVTEQVIARRKIEESEQKYRQIVELASEGIWTLNESMVTTFVNNALCKMLGYSREELIGSPLFAFMDEEWQQFAKEKATSRLEGNKTNFEFKFRRKDGRSVWVNVSTATLFNDQGLIEGSIGMITDISQRKKEEMVKDVIGSINSFFASESSLEMALSKSLEKICVSNEAKFVEAWVPSLDNNNIKLTAYFSCSKSNVNEVEPTSFKKGEGLPGKVWQTGKAIKVKDIHKDECFARKELAKANNLLSAIAIPVLYNTKVITVLIFYLDIIDEPSIEIDQKILFQLASEIQRKKAEEELDKFFNLSGDILCIAAKDGYFKKVNPAFSKILGYSEHELLSTPFMHFIHPDDHQRIIDVMSTPTEGRAMYNYECRYLTKDKSIKYLVWTVNYFKENLVIAVAKDVSEIKKIEKKAESYNKRINIILESITDAFFTIDRDFIVTYWNSQAAKLTTVDRENVIGRNLWDVFPGEISTKFYSEYNKAIRENVSVRFEEYFEPQQAWLEVSAYPSEEGLSVYFRDITASKNDYQHLVKTETDVRNFARQLNTILEEERTRIAREIHDEFGQQLAGIKMSIFSTKKLAGENNHLKFRLEEVLEDVDNTMQSLRSFATELRPGILDTMGLFASLEWLAKEFEKKTAIKCIVNIIAKEQELEKAFATCYFRICQEALTNVLKHAKAQKVVIQAYELNNDLVLEVIDDGIGIRENNIKNPFSMGFLGMKERAHLIGGSLEIKKGALGGTLVQLKARINAI